MPEDATFLQNADVLISFFLNFEVFVEDPWGSQGVLVIKDLLPLLEMQETPF